MAAPGHRLFPKKRASGLDNICQLFSAMTKKAREGLGHHDFVQVEALVAILIG